MKHLELSILNKTSFYIPTGLLQKTFHQIKKKNTMEVSVVFLGTRAMRMLNQTYRHRSVVPDVLAFPLGKGYGEICISPVMAYRDAHLSGLSVNQYIAYLFLHGLLHLCGYDHTQEAEARRMRRRETRIMNCIRERTWRGILLQE